MATNLPFHARQLYSALRGGKSLSRCPPSLISTNMLKRRAQSLLFPSGLTVSTIQQAGYTQRVVMNGEETDLSDMPIYISSTLHYTNKPTDHEAIAQARQKIQNEPLQLSKEPRMIGNKGGFDMFRELRAMSKSLDTLKAELKTTQGEIKTQQAKLQSLDALKAELKTTQGEVKTQQAKLQSLGAKFDILYDAKVRNGVIELIKRSKLRDRYITARNARNQDTYGADIKFHRGLLDLPNHDADISSACIKGFRSTYGISAAIYDSYVHEAPNEIIQVANRRGDLYHLHIYTKSRHHQKEISEMKKICDDILTLWVSQNKTTITEEIRTKISKVEHLHKLWEEGKAKRSHEKRKGTGHAPLLPEESS